MKDFITEKDEAKRDEIYDKICENIASQIPANLWEHLDAFRYMAMLGAPRTHIRNIGGNALFKPIRCLENYIGTVVQLGVKKSEKTYSARISKAAKEFAAGDVNSRTVQKMLHGGTGKYATISDIMSKRTIYKTKAFEKARHLTLDTLEAEDSYFLNSNYKTALARIITARGIDTNYLSSGTAEANQTLDNLRKFAIKQALEATYRDENAFATAISRAQRNAVNSKNVAMRLFGRATQGIFPFVKTPLNIAKQGFNYSELGFIKALYQYAKYKKGNGSFVEVTESITKGLVGTAISILGAFLSAAGILRAVGDDDDSKKTAFDKLVGRQNYALVIGGHSYTIDWAAPAVLPLFIGARVQEACSGKGISFADTVNAMSAIYEPLLELSVLSGVSDAISSAMYSKSNPVMAVASNMAANYITQFLPTLGGQISRIIDGKKRNAYYTAPDSSIPKIFNDIKAKIATKTPLISFMLEPSIDDWGREETYGSVFERIAENTISPGYYSKDKSTSVDKELERLYDETGENEVFPRKQQKSFTYKKQIHNLSVKDYTKAKKLRGQKSFELIEKLMSTQKYKNMSDENKVKAIKKCYDDAWDYTKEKLLAE